MDSSTATQSLPKEVVARGVLQYCGIWGSESEFIVYALYCILGHLTTESNDLLRYWLLRYQTFLQDGTLPPVLKDTLTLLLPCFTLYLFTLKSQDKTF